jgi:lambda family phage tail tape measure protein
MATIEDFILRFKTVGEGAIKSTSASIQNLKADVESFGQVGGPLQNTLGGIVSKLGPVGIAAAAAGAAISALGGTALRLAGEVMDISGATGIAAGRVNNFAASVIAAGGKAEDAAQILFKLRQSTAEAASGNEELQKAFQKLGIFVTDANGNVRDANAIFGDLITRFRAGGLSAAELTAAIDLAGKVIRTLETDKLVDLADPRYDEAARELDILNDKMELVGKQIKTQLVIAFGEFAKIVNEGGISSGLAKITESLGTLVGDILNLPTDAIAGILNMFGADIKNPVGLGTGVHALVERAKKDREQYQAEQVKFKAAQAAAAKAEAEALAKLNGKDKPKEQGGYGDRSPSGVEAAKQSAQRIVEMEAEVARQGLLKKNSERLASLLSQSDKETAQTYKLSSDLAAIQINAEADTAKEKLRIFANEKLNQLEKEKEFTAKKTEIVAKAASDEANIVQRFLEQSQRERERLAEEQAKEAKRIEEIIRTSKARGEEESALNKQMQDRNRLLNITLGDTDRERNNLIAITDIEEKREEILRRIRQIKDLPAAERAAREREINEIFEERIKITERQQEQDLKNQENFSKGFEKAFKTYAESAKNNFETAGRVFSKITQGMEDSIVDFAKTGKFEFRGFINSVLEELLRSQVRSLIAQTFGGLFGSTSKRGSVSIGDIIPGFAAGGLIGTNGPVIVGERGPELLVGAGGNRVIPNNELASGTVNYNISAVDAQSFKQLVASDPSFIYAVTEQGRRTIPSGRR